MEPLDKNEQYLLEMMLPGSNTRNQSLPKSVDKLEANTVNLKDSRTLAIGDQRIEKAITLRLLTAKGVEIARCDNLLLQPFFVSPKQIVKLRTQKLIITADPTKQGTLNLKIKYVPAIPQPVEPEQKPVVQPIKEEEKKTVIAAEKKTFGK